MSHQVAVSILLQVCHHMDFSLEANVPVVLVVVPVPNLGWTSTIHKAGVCQRLVRAALGLFE
jgi:hypothetical protein